MIHNNIGTIFTSTFFDNQFLSGFGTKEFGDGRYVEVMERYLFGNDLKVTSIVVTEQTHSTNVVAVTVAEDPVTTIPNCDGLVTTLKNVVLTALTADCVPIIYRDDTNGVVGVSHQGWKGTIENLPEKMISQMVELGAKTESIKCAIGPSVNYCCYEVYGPRYWKFKDVFSEQVFQIKGDKTYLNLNKANFINLVASGIKPANIDYFPFCTSCNEEKFWSYTRDKGIKGEMMNFVMQ